MGTHPMHAKKRAELRKKVIRLYKQGLTFREVGKMLEISHETTRQLWLESSVDKIA